MPISNSKLLNLIGSQRVLQHGVHSHNFVIFSLLINSDFLTLIKMLLVVLKLMFWQPGFYLCINLFTFLWNLKSALRKLKQLSQYIANNLNCTGVIERQS